MDCGGLDKENLMPAGRNPGHAKSRPSQMVQSRPCVSQGEGRHPMMELDQQLAHMAERAAVQRLHQHAIFRAFDVHFEHFDRWVAKARHDAAEAGTRR